MTSKNECEDQKRSQVQEKSHKLCIILKYCCKRAYNFLECDIFLSREKAVKKNILTLVKRNYLFIYLLII